METDEPKITLILIRSSDDPPLLSDEYRKELGDFSDALKAHGIKASQRYWAFDAIDGGGGPSGEFILLVTTLVPVAIVQLRKLLETYLKTRAARKVKLTNGTVSIEATAEDIQSLLTPEQVAKLLEPARSKKITHE